jgi:hypothetical protein
LVCGGAGEPFQGCFARAILLAETQLNNKTLAIFRRRRMLE